MSHYAKVCSGIVTNVIVAEADFFKKFRDTSPGSWIQTSYNTRGGIHYDPITGAPNVGGQPLRGNYASIGDVYDEVNDVFYKPQPYKSWTLNKTTWTWEPPHPAPVDGKSYTWDEATTSWKEFVKV